MSEESDLAIELRDVRFRWSDRGPDVLNIAELSIPHGQRVFIQGPSGSGKSTLLSLIGGVIRPARGEGAVHLLGHSLHRLRGPRRDAVRANHVGFIFQMFNLIPYLDALANVMLPCRFSRTRRQRAAAQGGVEAEARRLLEHLGLGEEEMLRRLPSGLSVGQQQRVAAARALIGAPEILIADEPTSALDADRKEVFIELLLRECAALGTTVLFVSHDASLEPLFDRSISMTGINRATSGPTMSGATASPLP